MFLVLLFSTACAGFVNVNLRDVDVLRFKGGVVTQPQYEASRRELACEGLGCGALIQAFYVTCIKMGKAIDGSYEWACSDERNDFPAIVVQTLHCERFAGKDSDLNSVTSTGCYLVYAYRVPKFFINAYVVCCGLFLVLLAAILLGALCGARPDTHYTPDEPDTSFFMLLSYPNDTRPHVVRNT